MSGNALIVNDSRRWARPSPLQLPIQPTHRVGGCYFHFCFFFPHRLFSVVYDEIRGKGHQTADQAAPLCFRANTPFSVHESNYLNGEMIGMERQ